MKHCARHFEDLYHMVKHKGMGSMVRPEQAEQFAHYWLNGSAKVHEFDPLVVSVLEINKKAMELCGPAIKQGECPLCTIAKVLQRKDAAETWIDNVTDAMLIFCKMNRLVH